MRTPARMICELKPPARPRSPVTSSRPTFCVVLVLVSSGRRDRLRAGRLRRLARHPPQRVRVGAQRRDPLLGAAQARGGDHLHRTGDLLDVLDRGDPVLDVALGGHGDCGSAALGRPRGSSLGARRLVAAQRRVLLQRLALLVEVVAEVARRTPRPRRARPSASHPTSRRRRSSRARRRAGSASVRSARQELAARARRSAGRGSRWWRRRSARPGPRPAAARARAG